MIRVKDLTKRFSGGVVALNGISFAIGKGEAVAVIGPSGAGKTTLLKALTRSIILDHGSVEINDHDLYALTYTNLKKVRNNIGVIYQQHNLVKELSVATNVAAGLLGSLSTIAVLRLLLAGPDPSLSKRVAACLNEVGISNRVLSRAGNLSGGEQQRVAVARLLMQDPDIILADEPIASVDPVSAERIMDALTRMSKYHGKTLICNIHNVEVACRYFERVLALRNGQIVFDGSPAELSGELLSAIYNDDKRSILLKDAPEIQGSLDKVCGCLELTAATQASCEQKGFCR